MSKHTDYDMETVSHSTVPYIRKAYREYERSTGEKKKSAKERLDRAVDYYIDEPRIEMLNRGDSFIAPPDFEERRKELLKEKGYQSTEDRRKSELMGEDYLHYFPSGHPDFVCPRGQEFVKTHVRKDGVRIRGYCREKVR